MPDPPTTALGASGSHNWVNLFGPGIVGLFIQGIETGMVFSQFATWLSLPGRTKHRFITILTVFITTVGLVQTIVTFLSSWRIYVSHNGEPITLTWREKIPLILTVPTATPVQSLLLWRCYCILNKNVYFIIPLLLLLLGTVALPIFESVGLFWSRGLYSGDYPTSSNAFWCYILYSALSSVLDITLSGILFRYLTQSRKRVYSDHTVQWISRHIIILWQSAIPPTLCASAIFIIYLASRHTYPGKLQMWYPMLQGAIGKLYVLSHFYNINSRPLFVGEQVQPSTYMHTLTLPVLHDSHDTSTPTLNALEEQPSTPITDSFGREDSAKG